MIVVECCGKSDPDAAKALNCWRPRRDLNPCYRRESGMAKRNFNKLEVHGRTGWRSRNSGEQISVSPPFSQYIHHFFVYHLYGATNLNRTFAVLKSEIETIEDPKHREIGRAMALLVSSLEVGPDADRLIEYTGFSPDFVRNIRSRSLAQFLNRW